MFMKKNLLYITTIGGLLTVPLFAFAQTTLSSLVQEFNSLFVIIPSVIIGLAIVFFFWQTLRFFKVAQSDEERTQAKAMMVYSIVAIFVMISLWGIIALLMNTLQLDTDRRNNLEEIIYDPI